MIIFKHASDVVDVVQHV